MNLIHQFARKLLIHTKQTFQFAFILHHLCYFSILFYIFIIYLPTPSCQFKKSIVSTNFYFRTYRSEGKKTGCSQQADFSIDDRHAKLIVQIRRPKVFSNKISSYFRNRRIFALYELRSFSFLLAVVFLKNLLTKLGRCLQLNK